jgi:hypothetical protein
VPHANAVGGDDRYFDAVDERVQSNANDEDDDDEGGAEAARAKPIRGKRWNHIDQLGASSQKRRTGTGHKRS